MDRNRVSFNGRWSFEPSSLADQTFHVSNTTGDRASATFNGKFLIHPSNSSMEHFSSLSTSGTAFILQGMTSPEAGNYSVTLDGTTTMFSARSSFKVLNTTLFFATGLNVSVTHSVEVTNNGGKLSLLEDGFWTVAAFSGYVPCLFCPIRRLIQLCRQVLSPDPGSKPPDAPLSGGTVAAFALAGILFAIITTLVLFLLWRKRNRKRPSTWDDKKYAVYNPKPGYGGSSRNSWRFRRRTQASSDFASFGAKGETMTLESGLGGARLEGSTSLRSGGNEFSQWQHEAVEGTAQHISLPILFKNSIESEFAPSPEPMSPESKHPYSVYDPIYNRDRSAEMRRGSLSTQDDIDLTSVALANLKNKGKARQITGAGSTMEDSLFKSESRHSFSPNDLLQGLHLKMSGGKNSSRIKTSQRSVSLSLNPPTYPEPRNRFRNSFLSSFHAASNPSARGQRESQRSPCNTPTETLPSVPRSVSDSNSNTIMPHYRQSISRRYLLDDQPELDESWTDEDLDSGEPLPPPPHAYRNQGIGRDRGSQSVLPNSLSQVVRSLSPRISEMGMDYNNSNIDHFYPETLAEDQSILEEGHLLTVKAPSTPSVTGDSLSSVQFAPPPLPSRLAETRIVGPSTQAELDGTKLSPILPSVKRTSPFNIRFDWQSEHQSKRVSESSRLRVPNFDSREEFVQGGASRNRFRLTPLTMMTHSPSMQSEAPSQVSTDIVTSFLDFTNSSEDSSTRTNSFSTQSRGSRVFGDPQSTQGSRMAKVRSRWSDTTASTRRRDSSREGSGIPSSLVDKSSRRKTYYSMIPPSIYVTSEIENQSTTKVPLAQRESDSTQFSTENPIHVHPSINPDVDSHRDSLPPSQRSPLDTTTLFRTGGSDESSATTSARWSTESSSNQFHTRLLLASRYPPLPEGTDEASTTNSVHPPQSPLPS